jgi:hypothetical protein
MVVVIVEDVGVIVVVGCFSMQEHRVLKNPPPCFVQLDQIAHVPVHLLKLLVVWLGVVVVVVVEVVLKGSLAGKTS